MRSRRRPGGRDRHALALVPALHRRLRTPDPGNPSPAPTTRPAWPGRCPGSGSRPTLDICRLRRPPAHRGRSPPRCRRPGPRGAGVAGRGIDGSRRHPAPRPFTNGQGFTASTRPIARGTRLTLQAARHRAIHASKYLATAAARGLTRSAACPPAYARPPPARLRRTAPGDRDRSLQGWPRKLSIVPHQHRSPREQRAR